jgi:hypothetical protein
MNHFHFITFLTTIILWANLSLGGIGDPADSTSSPLVPQKISWEVAQSCTNAAKVVILCLVDSYARQPPKTGTAEWLDWILSGVIHLSKHADTAGQPIIDPDQIKIFYIECGTDYQDVIAKGRLMHHKLGAEPCNDLTPLAYILHDGKLLDWFSWNGAKNAGPRGDKIRTLVREAFNPDNGLALPVETGAARLNKPTKP